MAVDPFLNTCPITAYLVATRVGYRLWGYYSRVILPLIRQAKLVWCIKCGGHGCFIWKLPHFLAFTSLLPSSAFNLMALVVYLQSPEKYLLLRLLRQAVLLDFPDWVIMTGLRLI